MLQEIESIEYKIAGVIPVVVEYSRYAPEPDVGIMREWFEFRRAYYWDGTSELEFDLEDVRLNFDDVEAAIRRA